MNHVSTIHPAQVAAMLEHPAEWHDGRKSGIGGSAASKIMDGEWLALWEEITGRTQPEDLSRILAVQMGSWTEPLNRLWFERETGLVVSTAQAVTHPKIPFMRCSPDGLIGMDGVFEAKHTNAFSKDEEIVARYFWQCQHNMACTESDVCHLSVFFGNSKWAAFQVPRDNDRIKELEARCIEFWGFVDRDEMPHPHQAPAEHPKIEFDKMREVEMTGNNEWGAFAADWLANKTAAKTFETSTKGIKEMVPEDVKKAFGHGVVASRSKAGSLTIKEAKP